MKKPTGMRLATIAAVMKITIFLLMADVALGQSAVAQPNLSAAAQPNIIMHTSNLRMADLANSPDTDIVQFAGNRSMSVGSLRKLAEIQKRMVAAKPGSKKSLLLNAHPDANNIKMTIHSASDFSAALKRPDSETVQLRTRLVTVGQLKFIREGEKRLGRTFIPVTERPGISGNPTLVSKATTVKEWEGILQKKSGDSTVLQSQKGTRVTVGELKQELARIYKAAGTAPPLKAAPSGGFRNISPDKTPKLPSSGGVK